MLTIIATAWLTCSVPLAFLVAGVIRVADEHDTAVTAAAIAELEQMANAA